MAIRILSTVASTCWRRAIGSTYSFQRLSASSQDKQSQEEAFWDVEGSVAVSPNQTGDLSYLATVEKKEPTPSEECDIVRITKFGHIRLDQENPATEIKASEETQHSDSANYIDTQFFGNKLSHQSTSLPPQDHSTVIKASDVPVDTNPVDQQYFYPNSSPQEKGLESQLVSPQNSASELEFKENEVDNQYFGGKSVSSVTKQKVIPTKVSAYEYLRSFQSKSADSNNKDNQSVDNNEEVPKATYADMVPNLYKMPNELIVNLLKRSILYNKDGIVALNKPYGLVTTDSDGKSKVVLTNLLPELSKALRFEKLYTVHRLDRDTTGILLLASNQDVANKLNTLFLEHKISKKYLAITKGVPTSRKGTIDIPLCEKNMDNRQRMALRPVMQHSDNPSKSAKYNAKMKSFKAITHFQVNKSSGSAAFVELEPETGVRHQLRVHLSEALSCPVLGDHKYSHDDKFAPQKLPQDMLERLDIKQSKVRNVPMHLHAAAISIPGFGEEGNELKIYSPLPAYFRYTMKKLKFSKRK